MPAKYHFNDIFAQDIEQGIQRIDNAIVRVATNMKKLGTIKSTGSGMKDLNAMQKEVIRLEKEIQATQKGRINLQAKIDTGRKNSLNSIVALNKQKQKQIEKDAKLAAQKKKLADAYDYEAVKKKQLQLLTKKELRDLVKLEVEYEKYGAIETKSINGLRNKTRVMQKYADTLDKTGIKYKRLTKEIRKNEKALQKHERRVGRGTRGVGRYSQAIKSSMGMFIGFTAVVFGLFRAIGSMIKIYANFEKAASKLQSILGKTKNEMTGLKKQAKLLGSTTAFTASEVLGLQTELAKLGFTMNQIQDATPGILSLAAATGIELPEAANIAGSALRIFGLEASEMGRVTDVLAESTSRSALDMSKLSTALPIVGTTAKQAGFNIEQTSAMLGILANRGLDASSSATGLRNIFLELSKKGISFKDAMKQIANSTDKSKTSMDLFGKRSAAAGVILSETGVEVEELEGFLNDAAGAAERMAEVQLDNLIGDVTKMKSAWEGMVLSIESGDGAISQFFRLTITRLTQMLSLITKINNGMSFWEAYWSEEKDMKASIKNYNEFLDRLERRSKRIRRVQIDSFEDREATAEEQRIFQLEQKQELIEQYRKQFEGLTQDYKKYTKLAEEDLSWDRMRYAAKLKITEIQKRLIALKEEESGIVDFVDPIDDDDPKKLTSTEIAEAQYKKGKELLKIQQKIYAAEYELAGASKDQLRALALQHQVELLEYERDFGVAVTAKQVELYDVQIALAVKKRAELLRLQTGDIETGAAKAGGTLEGLKQVKTGLTDLEKILARFKDEGDERGFLAKLLNVKSEDEEHLNTIVNQTAQMLNQLADQYMHNLELQRQANQEVIDMHDSEIEKLEEKVEAEEARLRTLDEAGAGYSKKELKRLNDKLKAEQQAKEEAEKKDIELKKKQKSAELVRAGVGIAASVIQALASSPPPFNFILAGITASLGAIQLSQIKAAKYAKGTNYLELGGNPDGEDTIPILADKGERIVPRKDNKGIPRSFPNSMLPMAIDYFLKDKNNDSGGDINIMDSNSLNDVFLSEIAQNTRNNRQYDNNGNLIEERFTDLTIYYE